MKKQSLYNPKRAKTGKSRQEFSDFFSLDPCRHWRRCLNPFGLVPFLGCHRPRSPTTGTVPAPSAWRTPESRGHAVARRLAVFSLHFVRLARARSRAIAAAIRRSGIRQNSVCRLTEFWRIPLPATVRWNSGEFRYRRLQAALLRSDAQCRADGLADESGPTSSSLRTSRSPVPGIDRWRRIPADHFAYAHPKKSTTPARCSSHGLSPASRRLRWSWTSGSVVP